MQVIKSKALSLILTNKAQQTTVEAALADLLAVLWCVWSWRLHPVCAFSED